jgi:hypothetical protein
MSTDNKKNLKGATPAGDWVLERYLLQELPEAKMKEIRLRLKDDPDLYEKVEQLRLSNKEVLNRYPPETIAPQILNVYGAEMAKEESISAHRTVPGTGPGFSRRLLYTAPAFVLVLVMVFLLVPFHQESTRIKGDRVIDMSKTHLLIYRKTGDDAELLENGTRAKAGDLLQMAYVTAAETYGIILSIDGNRTVTLHYPEKQNRSPHLRRRKKVLLATAYELDDAPGFERFFFITSTSLIDVGAVLEQAKQLAQNIDRAKIDNIALPGGVHQVSILITKI